MKNGKKLAAVLLAVIMLLGVLAGCGGGDAGGETVNITVTVIHGDGSEKTFEVETAEEMLGRALVEAEIVVDNQSTYGLYMLTVDGETVNEANQEWWCATVDGEPILTGVDEVELAEGESYEITFTVGY